MEQILSVFGYLIIVMGMVTFFVGCALDGRMMVRTGSVLCIVGVALVLIPF